MVAKCLFSKGKDQRYSLHEKNTVSADIITTFLKTEPHLWCTFPAIEVTTKWNIIP
jgi:hypothetical protein